MTTHEERIREYQQKKAELRRQIDMLESGDLGAGEKKLGTHTRAAIKNAERKLAELDDAIARLRKKGG